MKKIFSFICALLLCVSPLLFVACKKTEKPIDPSFYLEEKAYYTVYGRSGNIDDKYSTFTDNKFDNMTQYTTIGFTGNSANLYKMTLKSISFDICANQSAELQFYIRISNLRNGDTDEKGSPKFVITVSVSSDGVTTVTVPIGDYFESLSSTISIVIGLDDETCYFSDETGNGKVDTGLKIDISNFKMYGSHDLKNTK